MKKLWILILLTVLLVGCNGFQWGTSEQRIANLEKAVATSQAAVANMDKDVATLQDIITRSQTYLATAGLDADTTAKLTKILTDAQNILANTLAKKMQVQTDLTSYQQQILAVQSGEQGLGQELQLYGQGIQKIGGYVPQPIGPWVGLGGTGLALIGSIIVSLQKLKKKDATTTNIVESVDALLKSLSEAEAAKAKLVLKDSQTPEARAVVMEVHNT